MHIRVLATLLMMIGAPAEARGRYHRVTTVEEARGAPQLLAVVSDPRPNEACFSPEEPCGAKLIKFVQGARTSLDLAVYDINLDQLVESLAQRSKQIPVRVVVDQRQARGEHSLVTAMVKAGVKVRYGRQRGIMHHKFVIRDGALLETGSFNFTNSASLANHENQIYLDQPAVLSRYKTRFAKLWAQAQPVAPGVSYGKPNGARRTVGF